MPSPAHPPGQHVGQVIRAVGALVEAFLIVLEELIKTSLGGMSLLQPSGCFAPDYKWDVLLPSWSAGPHKLPGVFLADFGFDFDSLKK